MNLLNLADMLSDILDVEDVFAGNINAEFDKCVGVYNSKQERHRHICVGGKACTKTREKHISILIHWTDNPTQAEAKAQSILETLSGIREYNYGGFSVKYLECNEPVPVGRDDRGICEYVIETIIYYERTE